MDTNPTAPAASDPRLRVPEQSNASTILNGMGNGMMLGAAPFVLLKMASQLTGKPIPIADKIGTFGTVIGCAIGAAYGGAEARHVEQYRQAVGERLQQLGQQAEQSNQRIAELTAALNARGTAQPAR